MTTLLSAAPTRADSITGAPRARRKSKAARRGQPSSSRRPSRSFMTRLVSLARPRLSTGAVIACAAFTALMTGVVVNALYLQTGKHQAPLFARADASVARKIAPAPALAPAAAPAPAPAPAVAPTPPRRSDAGESLLSPRLALEPETPPAPPSRPVLRSESTGSVAKKETPTRRVDAIGALLLASAPPSAKSQEKAAAKPASEPASPLMATQKALAALGYDVAVDGLAGPKTRQAIEAFEKKHGLPVTGEPSARLSAKLSTPTARARP